MQPGGDEKSTNIPGRPMSPFFVPPQASTSIPTPRPLPGMEFSTASRVRAPFSSINPTSVSNTLSVAQTARPFLPSTPLVGPGESSFGGLPPMRFDGPSSSVHPSYPTQYTGQQFLAPQFPPPTQPTRLDGANALGPPVRPPPLSITQSQVPPVPISPPQIANPFPSQGPLASTPTFPGPIPMQQPPTFPGPIPMRQPTSHGYSSNLPRDGISAQIPLPLAGSTIQPSIQASLPASVPRTSPFLSHGGYVLPPPPTSGTSVGFNSREQVRFPSSAPPLGGALESLVEEFQSLSVASAPGSTDQGIDRKSLPRPLNVDIEPTSVLESYPLNCHPRYVQLTTHSIPNSQSLFARWHLPLGAIVQPLAEAPDGEVPVINFGSAGIIRCRRCRTYVNPFATFTDSGRKWRCNLCSLLNDVPGEYFCALDANGRRLDIDQRPELSKGSVEFVAPAEYMVRPPMPPSYFFLIDVSVYSVRTGLLEVVAKTIKDCLDKLSGLPRTQIGFLTFDNTLHFYSLKSSLTQPQMMVVADLDDIFLPLPDDLLVNLADSRNVVDALLDSLPSMFSDNVNIESAFGPALKASFMILSQLGGKLLVFQSTLPSLGVGCLRLRGDDPRLYGTDKEHPLRAAEDPFYKQMAAELTKHQIAVDIYSFSEKYSDIASLGTLSKYTGGQVYHYPGFQAAMNGEKLSHELTRNLTRETAWEAVMRIRCGKGVRFSSYHGHFMLRSMDLLALPAVDCDKAFAMQLALEETLMTTQTVYFQVALLYTSSSGERRIRVLTAAVPVVSDLGVMYRNANTGAIVSLLSRLAIERTLSNKLEDARQFLQLKLVKSLKEYRNLYVVQHRLGGRLIYPESLKFLPLYVLSLCKSLALRGGYADAPLDERCAAGYRMMILPVRNTLKLLHPSLIQIDENFTKGSKGSEDIQKELPLTFENLNHGGLYILNDGFDQVIWFGRMLSSDIVGNVLGVDLRTVPDFSKVVLCERNNDLSRNLMMTLRRMREKDPSYYQTCHVVRQGEQPREGTLFLSKLVEDQIFGTMGYANWILQIHNQSQSS